jgi:hypothetical protein
MPATQPKQHAQPTTYDSGFSHCSGANSDVQWYSVSFISNDTSRKSQLLTAASSRRHARELSHTRNHGKEAQPDNDRQPDCACSAAVEQAEVAGQKS